MGSDQMGSVTNDNDYDLSPTPFFALLLNPRKQTMKIKLLKAFLIMLLSPCLVLAGNQKSRLDILVNALVVCPPLDHKRGRRGAPTRFVDNGDGTICDHGTGLMWEMKNGEDGIEDLNNPRDLDNNYSWTSLADGDDTNPDGTAFTDFLARLNGEVASSLASEQLGGHSDWRLPTSAELQTILDCSLGLPPCIVDPIFDPTAAAAHWSSTSIATLPNFAWHVDFGNGIVMGFNKGVGFRVRAVRGGR
jgi:hypothetical protein